MPKSPFGIPEIIEYAKTVTDPKVKIILKRLFEARSKNAQWCNALAKAQGRINRMEGTIKTHAVEHCAHCGTQLVWWAKELFDE